MNESRKKESKRPYKKPTVEKVVLMPDEMVLGACKNNPHDCDGSPAKKFGS